VEKSSSDEYFIHDEDAICERQFAAHGFGSQKIEYNYTTADVLDSTYFDFDSAKILPDEWTKIADVAKMVLKDKFLALLVVGNCDMFGSERYNETLGERRAKAVRDVLMSLGVDNGRITIASLGSQKANRAVKAKEEGMLDRRCDIVIFLP
jgi:peptidoglycan-associated lipoprotein